MTPVCSLLLQWMGGYICESLCVYVFLNDESDVFQGEWHTENH